ncbi:hypothetical protein OE88DRAFT_1654117 [Heliocybe sulcata]|uniref:PEBP-like protein n=1 Tax=Heliocybe sulcata TaxID=5364 RepID=A0A5C3NFR4_9AGAM|nr:hypothetical protein OE88DRAFT_1654117 [Heliocybe sulcata]
MLSQLVFLTLALISSAFAQDNATYGPYQLAATRAHLSQAGIIPPLLPNGTFEPLAYVNVSFPGVGQIGLGQTLSPDQVQQPPNITVTFLPSESGNDSVDYRTLKTMVVLEDVGTAGFDFPLGQTRTWLVYDASLQGADGCSNCSYKDYFTLATDSGTTVTDFHPLALSGNGPNRYVLLLFGQTTEFRPPNTSISVPVDFTLQSFMNETVLSPQDVYAAFYFDLQNGTATASASPTSPVISSTLADHAASTLYPTFSTYAVSESGASASTTASRTSGAETILLRWEGIAGLMVGAVAVGWLIQG